MSDFNEPTWRVRAAAKLQQFNQWFSHGEAPYLAYGAVAGLSLWPLVEAAGQAPPGQLPFSLALALGSVAGGVGTTLIAEQLQHWRDRAEPVTENEVIAWIQANVAAQPDLLPALDAIIAKLDAIPTVQSTLSVSDQEWFTQTLRQELAQLGNGPRYSAVLHGSGAIAQGEGATAVGAGGVNVKGNVEGSISTRYTHIEKQIIEAEDKEAEALIRAEQRYLQRMIRYCNALPLAAMGGDDGAGEEISLDRVYISLDTMRRVPLTAEVEQERRADGQRPVLPGKRPLSILEAVTQQRQMVILGEPGSGKSTFLRQLAAWLAEAVLNPAQKPPPPGWPPMIPLIVTLRELAQRLEPLQLSKADEVRKQQLLTAVHAQWRQELHDRGAAELDTVLQDWLLAGRVILLFDGLDEVGLAVRQRIREAVKAVRSAYEAPILVTCRVRSYTGTAVLPGFATETLAPFDGGKIENFIADWYQAQVVLGRLTPSGADEKRQDLQQAAVSGDLKELAANPMLLTTMAIVHQGNVGLPKERVRLYSLAVQVLLRRWQKAKGLSLSAELSDLLDDERRLRSLLHGLAYETHKLQETAGRGASLGRWDILKLLEGPQYLDDLGLAEQFLDYVDKRAGLLVGQGGGEEGQKPASYGFPHRTFQEYLAGCHMVTGRSPSRNYWPHMGSGDYWYLAAELGSEELLYNNPQGQTPFLDLAYDLCPAGEPAKAAHWRGVVWSGRMATLLPREDILADDSQPDSGPAYLKRLIPRLVSALGEMALERGERAAAGRSLARLGDPRPEVMTVEAMRFCYVPPGPFWMGSDEDDPDASDNEKPLHQLDLPYGYWLGEYPVTNAQFAQFIAAGGYDEAAFWPLAVQHGVWQAGYFFDKGEWEDEKRNRPYDWGEPYTLPNHPVVGVTWYESAAFARWLTTHWAEKLPPGWSFRLPSEAEWEKAARGGIQTSRQPCILELEEINNWQPESAWQANPRPQRRFPWENDAVAMTPNPNLVNYNASGIITTSAPGCFPGNVAPYGCREMSGNVWEWTCNREAKYPYNLANREKQRESGSDWEHLRRGGAYYTEASTLRCAARNGIDPDSGNDEIGFRVCASVRL